MEGGGAKVNLAISPARKRVSTANTAAAPMRCEIVDGRNSGRLMAERQEDAIQFRLGCHAVSWWGWGRAPHPSKRVFDQPMPLFDGQTSGVRQQNIRGARSRNRTGTAFYGLRILSPLRLPISPSGRNVGLWLERPQETRDRIGGGGRNRTGIDGFAGRCITTLPPSLGGM